MTGEMTDVVSRDYLISQIYGPVDLWCFGPSSESVAYVTIALQVPLHTEEDVACLEVALAALSLVGPLSDANDTKLFLRRQYDWIILELAAPRSIKQLPASFFELLQRPFTPLEIANAVELVQQATDDHHEQPSAAHELGWLAALGSVPAPLLVPQRETIEAIDDEKVSRFLRGLVKRPRVLITAGTECQAAQGALRGLDAWKNGEAGQRERPSRRREPLSVAGGRILLVQGSLDVIRLVVPYPNVDADPRNFFALLAVVFPFGGTHHSRLAQTLRDSRDVDTYLPRAGVQQIHDTAFITLDLEVGPDGMSLALDQLFHLLRDYFEGGGWRDSWVSGVRALKDVYQQSWMQNRGKGVAVVSNYVRLGTFSGIEGLLQCLDCLDEEFVASVVSGIDLSSTAGSVVTTTAYDSIASTLSSWGLDVVEEGLV